MFCKYCKRNELHTLTSTTTNGIHTYTCDSCGDEIRYRVIIQHRWDEPPKITRSRIHER